MKVLFKLTIQKLKMLHLLDVTNAASSDDTEVEIEHTSSTEETPSTSSVVTNTTNSVSESATNSDLHSCSLYSAHFEKKEECQLQINQHSNEPFKCKTVQRFFSPRIA